MFVRGVHAEAAEDDVLDRFSEFGEVRNLTLSLDRRTGFIKVCRLAGGVSTLRQGYALIEYAEKSEAEAAIQEMNGKDLLGLTLAVDWAFLNGAYKGAVEAADLAGRRGDAKMRRTHSQRQAREP